MELKVQICRVIEITKSVLSLPDLSMKNKEICSSIMLTYVISIVRGANYEQVGDIYTMAI